MVAAWSRKRSSPSFSEMELTMHLPCTHFKAASTTFQSDESIISGTRAISGSEAMILRKVTISRRASISPSSILMSMTRAPSATWRRAMEMASSYFFSLISLRNFFEPATLQRSPTLTNPTSGVSRSTSSPLSSISFGGAAGTRGIFPSAAWAKRRMKRSSVPQQPPTILTSPSSMSSSTSGAIVSAVSS